MNYQKRIRRIQSSLRSRKIDAFLVSQPQNRFFLSGYSASDHGIEESSGMLLIPASGDPLLLTDFRYKIQAEQEAKQCKVVLYPKGLTALLQTLLKDLAVKNLAFESHYTLHSVSETYKKLAKTLKFSLSPLTGLIEKLRLIKSEEEIARLEASIHLNEKVFQHVKKSIAIGETEIDVALRIENTMRQMGADGAGFDTIVASGKNSALPHAVPSKQVIEKNKPLMIDMGLILNGYCSDMTRTFVLGELDKKYLKIHRLVRKAQLAAMEQIKDGIPAAKIDTVARDVISSAGYGKYFGHALGHGVGIAVHEEPRLSSRNRKHLKAGMVVTVEPGIYLPDWGGVRLENMVLVTKDGCRNLNKDTYFLDI